MSWTRGLLCALAMVAFAWNLQAQEEAAEPEYERVAVRVVSISRKSVFLDHGSEAGIEAGDRVLLLPSGGAAVEGVVRSVSSRSARAELERVAIGVRIDTPGEVLVPRERLTRREAPVPPPGSTGAEAPTTPEHPPWTHPPEQWSEDTPLLAPAQGLEPEEREPRLRGRTFLQLDGTQDRYGEDSDDVFARAGVDLVWDNPFSRGGQLELDAEYVYRSIDFDNADDDTDSEFRPRYLSYSVGGTRTQPRRLEVGRFMQEGFPEFGLLDGVEFSHRIGERQLVGGSIGFLTDTELDLGTGNDQQVATYFRHELSGAEGIGFGVGAQKTWHHWSADRDILVADVDWRPSDKLMLRSSAVVDYYTSGDDDKDDGLELTEAHVYGSWRPSRNWGASVNADRMRWPDLDRDEFDPPVDDLRDRRFERLGLRIWRNVTQNVRVSTRADLWGTQDESGEGGELRVDWNDLLWDDGRVSFTGFTSNGEFADVDGVRVSLERDTPAGLWSLEWELRDIDHGEADFSSDDELFQHLLRAGWDKSLGTDWDVSLFVEDRFGDGQDAVSAGLYLQHSF